MWKFQNGTWEFQPSSNQPGDSFQLLASSAPGPQQDVENGSFSLHPETETSGNNLPQSSDESSPRPVPAIVHYIKMEDGSEMKFSQMIFQSGKQLLTDKIINVSEGKPQEKYNTGAHLQYLNTMFPVTRQFAPAKVSKRITSYMSHCRTRVKDQGKTGQGKHDGANYSQEFSEEEELLQLLHDTNKSCDAIPMAMKHYGAKTRYAANSAEPINVDSLEDDVSCMICSKSQVDMVSTTGGQLCLFCYQKKVSGDGSMSEEGDLTGQREVRKRQEVANVRKNDALLNMTMPGGEAGGSKKGIKTKAAGDKKNGKKIKFESDEEEDDSLNEILKSELKGFKQERELEAEKKKLEMEKIKLEIAIKKKELQKLNQSD